MITSNTQTSYFAASDVSHHSINLVTPMEFSPLPVFFEPTLSSAAKDGLATEISLTYSFTRTKAGSKLVSRGAIK